MTDTTGSNRELDDLSPEWQRGFAWVEQALGGRVCNLQRQGRWRPAWFFDLDKGGELLPLYFRGDRGWEEGQRVESVLEHEWNVYRVMEQYGLRVPHVYGLCPEPKGLVMERVPGRFNLGTVEDVAEQRSVLEHYIELIADLHRIPIAEFEAYGLMRPAGERGLALGDFDAWVENFRKAKRRPEPMWEFAIQWIYRNIPAGRTDISCLQADSGQFMFEDGRVTALIDMELAYLGDPRADLGGLFSRDLGEPLGNLAHAIRHYARVSGRAVDLDVVRFHALRFNLCTSLVMAHFVAGAQPGEDQAMYQAWSIVWGRAALAGIAELTGMELPPLPQYALKPTSRAPAYDTLVHKLRTLCEATPDEGGRYALDQPLRIALALQRADALGPAFDAIEVDEMAALLGRRVEDIDEANAQLERLVMASGPERDAEFLAYFLRRVLREHELHRPALLQYGDRELQPFE